MREPTLAGMRVLVLEDEFLIAMDVEQLCRDLGAAEVCIARAPADVPAGKRGFDLAVVDVSVDGGQTLDFARSLKHARVPFLFATGYVETDTLFAAFPGVPVLSKPYAPEAFARAAEAALGARRRDQAAFDPSTCDAIASGP